MASTPLPHTLGHVHCPACEAELFEALRAANSATLSFSEAARLWLINSREEVADQTFKDRELFIGRLNRFFGPMILNTIHIGNIRQYQKARQGKADRPEDNLGARQLHRIRSTESGRQDDAAIVPDSYAGAELINHEISALSRILHAAGLWAAIKPHYKCMRVPKYGPGRGLDAAERERLVMCAASNPRWRVAYLCTLLSLNLTRGAGEVRKVKVKDIDLRARNLTIEEGAKNTYRKVDFPMNDTVHWCCGQLLKRYYRLCEKYSVVPSPEHYVLPARIRRGYGYDFTKPQGDWRSAWDSLCEKAGLNGRFRMYDLRHDGATRLGEDPETADQMKRDILGHIDKRMEKRYFHAHREAKLEALKNIEVTPAPKIIETVDGFVQIPVIPTKKPAK